MRKRLNFKYLGCLLGIIFLLGTSVHFLHAFQVQRNAGSLLTQADRTEEEGDLQQTADYLKRYLALMPHDTDALARYGLLLAHEKLAVSPNARFRAMLVLDQVLRLEPDRPDSQDLRRRAARLAMDLQRFSDAQEHLQNLLVANPTDGELERLLGRCYEAKGKYKEARKHFEGAIDHQPQEIENHERLAYLLRYRTDEVIRRKANTAQDEKRADVLKEADKTIDAMVTLNEQSFRAYLARARYRKAFASPEDTAQTLKNIEKDVIRARDLAPGDADVLLAVAELAQDQAAPLPPEQRALQMEKARGCLQEGCKQHPRDWRMYQALARLEVQEGQTKAALTCLRKALEELPQQTDLLWSLADLLVQSGHKAEAKDAIARLGKLGFHPAALEYLNAGLRFHQEEWLDAARLLERAYPLLLAVTNQEQDWFFSNLAQQTSLFLGRCYEQLGDSDRAYASYNRVVARDPRSVPGRLGLAQTQWALGRLDESLDQYRQLMRLPNAPLGGWIDMARLLLLRNQRSDQPDWNEVDRAIAQAEKLQPLPPEVTVLRAELLATQAQKQDDTSLKQKLLHDARALLEKDPGDKKPRPVEIWTALAALDDLEGKPESALARLKEAEKQHGDGVELRLAFARHWTRLPGAEAPKSEARKSLAKLTQDLAKLKLKTEDQRRLLRGLANAYLQLGALAESEGLWKQLAEQQPNNLESRVILFDFALRAGNEEAMERLVQDMQRIEGNSPPARETVTAKDPKADQQPAGTLWRHAQACRLIRRAQQGDKERLPEARSLLADVSLRRPNWSRVPLCEAQIDDLDGKPDAALAHYRRAIQMGERSPEIVSRAVELLYKYGQYPEAYQLLQKMPEQTLLSGNFQRVAAEVSLRVQDNLRALSLAQKAVSNESKDYRDHLWLGQMFWAARQPEKAEQELCRARDLADKVPDTWVALIHYLASTGQKAKAEGEIDKAERKLAKDQAALALAQCYEVVGRMEKAKELYQAALAAKSEDAITLQAIASFYVRTSQFQDAQLHLRKLLHAEYRSKAPEVAQWARRTLAVLLTLEGKYQKSQEALELLTQGASGPSKAAGTDADLRTKAAVLAMQNNAGARREAIRILENLQEGRATTPEDQFLLAQLYEAAGDWPRAHYRWLNLMERQGDNALYLSQYARSMLRHDQVNEAEQALTKLEKLAPTAFSTKEIKARVLKAQGKNNEAVAVLKSEAQGKDADLAAIAALLEELGEASAAEEMYRKYVEQSKQPESILVLVYYLGRQRRFGEALDFCDRAWQTCPPVAVAQASLLVLSEAPVDKALFARVERRLQAAIQKSPETVALLSALAFLRNSQERYEEAEVAYRQILEKDYRNATAMNNLAWLLSFKGDKGEALELVQKAYEVVGPEPGLLDTRAVVYLTMGQSELAIKDLEDGLAQRPEAALYFHLAQAYQMAKNRKAASEALREAKTRGLKDSSLHPLERKAYQRLLRELDQKR